MAENNAVPKAIYAAAISLIEETLAATTDPAEQERFNKTLDDLRLKMEYAPDDAPSTDDTTSTEDTTTSTEETPA
jgi:hypothetical protein